MVYYHHLALCALRQLPSRRVEVAKGERKSKRILLGDEFETLRKILGRKRSPSEFDIRRTIFELI